MTQVHNPAGEHESGRQKQMSETTRLRHRNHFRPWCLAARLKTSGTMVTRIPPSSTRWGSASPHPSANVRSPRAPRWRRPWRSREHDCGAAPRAASLGRSNPQPHRSANLAAPSLAAARTTNCAATWFSERPSFEAAYPNPVCTPDATSITQSTPRPPAHRRHAAGICPTPPAWPSTRPTTARCGLPSRALPGGLQRCRPRSRPWPG